MVRLSLTLLALLLWAAAAFVAPGFALMAGPAMLLLLLLFNGIRPGERLIERYRRRAPVRPRRRALACVRAPRTVVRFGRLIASGLAMRPPPTARVVLSY